MAELCVNQDDCVGCGECVATCPLRIIRLHGGYPMFVNNGPERCIICGHCEAVCPVAAITIRDPRLDQTRYAADYPPLPKEQFAHHLRMRRSIRRFVPQPVNKQLLQELLELMRYAPTGANRQEIKWLVVYDTAEVRRLTGLVVEWLRYLVEQGTPLALMINAQGMIKSWLKGHDPICRNAPHLLIPYADQHEVVGKVDGIIALSYLDLAAPVYGLGTCWGGYFQMACEEWPPLLAALGLPDGHLPLYAMMLGQPDVRYHRPPQRNRGDVTWR